MQARHEAKNATFMEELELCRVLANAREFFSKMFIGTAAKSCDKCSPVRIMGDQSL